MKCIKKPTVFILGAGASVPYGFPTGQQLVDEIISSPQWLSGETRERNAELKEKDEVARSILKLSRLQSIDQFLRENPRFHDWGRARVSQCILESEYQWCRELVNLVPSPDNARRLPSGGDWLRYLWSNYLASSPTELNNHQVSFITYNYDRLLEFTLENALYASYSPDRLASVNARSLFPVIHLHGNVGQLPVEGENSKTEGIRFGDTEGHIKRGFVAKTWQFVWEAETRSPEFQRAVELVSKAEQIVVIGLGQATESLKMLCEAAAKAQPSALRPRAHLCVYKLKRPAVHSLLAAVRPLEAQVLSVPQLNPEMDALDMLTASTLLV